MEIRIQGRQVEVGTELTEFVRKKLNKLERHLPKLSEARVELRREATRAATHRMAAEVTLELSGTKLRAEERASTAQSAVEAVVDVLDRRLERHKGRVYRSEQAKKSGKVPSLRHLEAQEAPAMYEQAEGEEGAVVRVKRFGMRPTTVNDAINEMENLGHVFYLFFNAESGELNVVYRRDDGNYGLIEPQLQ